MSENRIENLKKSIRDLQKQAEPRVGDYGIHKDQLTTYLKDFCSYKIFVKQKESGLLEKSKQFERYTPADVWKKCEQYQLDLDAYNKDQDKIQTLKSQVSEEEDRLCRIRQKRLNEVAQSLRNSASEVTEPEPDNGHTGVQPSEPRLADYGLTQSDYAAAELELSELGEYLESTGKHPEAVRKWQIEHRYQKSTRWDNLAMGIGGLTVVLPLAGLLLCPLTFISPIVFLCGFCVVLACYFCVVWKLSHKSLGEFQTEGEPKAPAIPGLRVSEKVRGQCKRYKADLSRYKSDLSSYKSRLRKEQEYRREANKKWWLNRNADQFEKAFQKLLKDLGYSAKRSTRSTFAPDGGIDIYAEKDGEKIAIQCKHWKGKVGINLINELNGVRDGAEGWMVASTGVTRAADKQAKRFGIRVVTLDDIVEMAEERKQFALEQTFPKLEPDHPLLIGEEFFDDEISEGDKAFASKKIAEYTEAIRLDPEDAMAHLSRASYYKNTGDNEKAIADYTEALQIEDKLFPAECAYSGRGSLLSKKGEFEKAIADYTESLLVEPDSEGDYLGRGIAHTKKGDFNKAIADFTEAIRLEPDFSYAYHNRGVVYKEIGQKSKADADFAKAKELGYTP